jgi:hypothetical protein
MVRNLERVLAKLPPERREKVERRAAELATLKDLRQAVNRAQEELASYLGVGQDIRNAFYAVNDGYKYFRMELYGSPNQDANGYASIYGFFINSGNGWNFPLYLDPLVVPTVDSFLNATVTPTLSGNLQFLPDGRTFNNLLGIVAFDDLRFDRNGKYLDWAIPQNQLPDNFTWLAATLHSSTLTVLAKTAAVAPPIPSAALLLGTGIIGLVGLRRRGFRKA